MSDNTKEASRFLQACMGNNIKNPITLSSATSDLGAPPRVVAVSADAQSAAQMGVAGDSVPR